MMLFALMEPENGDNHNVFVDGLLMSPDSRRIQVGASSRASEQFRQFLDSQGQVPQGA
jgi:hypothetical protein